MYVCRGSVIVIEIWQNSGLILGLRLANERRRYFVTKSLIGLAHAYNQPCEFISRHL